MARFVPTRLPLCPTRWALPGTRRFYSDEAGEIHYNGAGPADASSPTLAVRLTTAVPAACSEDLQLHYLTSAPAVDAGALFASLWLRFEQSWLRRC